MRALFLVAVVLVSACSPKADRDEEPAKPGAPRADGGVPPPSRPVCDTVAVPEGELQNRATGSSVFGQVVGGDPGSFDALGRTECGIPGVRVCRHGTAECTEANEAGQFVLNGLPADEDVEISFEKAGYLRAMRPIHTGSVPINLMQTRVGTAEPWFEFLEKAGQPQDPNLGLIIAAPIAVGEGIGGFVLPAGVVATLDPAGPSPVYSAGSASPGDLSSDEIVPELTATHEGGWALFLNVVPGEYAVRFAREGQPCSVGLPGYGYGVNADGGLRLKTLAGTVTAGISVLCQ